MQAVQSGSGRASAAILGGAVLALVLWQAPAAQAASLNLLPVPPDVFASQVGVTYNATTDSFSANGVAISLDDDGSGPVSVITNGTLAINATINGSGALSGGSISIGGTIPSLGYNSGTLLTGSLSQVGFPTTGSGGTFDPLEFLFSATGGDLASLYDPTASNGVILSFSGYPGSWANDFSNITAGQPAPGVADVFAPVPGAVWLLGSGLAVLLGFGRGRRTA
jgi:hypothetical protein